MSNFVESVCWDRGKIKSYWSFFKTPFLFNFFYSLLCFGCDNSWYNVAGSLEIFGEINHVSIWWISHVKVVAWIHSSAVVLDSFSSAVVDEKCSLLLPFSFTYNLKRLYKDEFSKSRDFSTVKAKQDRTGQKVNKASWLYWAISNE